MLRDACARQVVAQHSLFGWTNTTVAEPCAWDGVDCHNGLLQVSLRYLGLAGGSTLLLGQCTARTGVSQLRKQCLRAAQPLQSSGKEFRAVLVYRLTGYSMRERSAKLVLPWLDFEAVETADSEQRLPQPSASGWHAGQLDYSWESLGRRCSVFNFDGAAVTGDFPGSWGKAFQHMFFISMAYTNITGSLPDGASATAAATKHACSP